MNAWNIDERRRIAEIERRLNQTDLHFEASDKEIEELSKLKKQLTKIIYILYGIGIAVAVALVLLGAISIDQIAKWIK